MNEFNDGQKIYYKYLLKQCLGERNDLTSAIVHVWRDWGSVPNFERIAYNKLSSDERNEVLYKVADILRRWHKASYQIDANLDFEIGELIDFNGQQMQVTKILTEKGHKVTTISPILKGLGQI